MRKIKEFQFSRGLDPDGVIGPITLGALRSKFNLSKEQISNFMGQCHVETGGFEKDTESLNYTCSSLISHFSYYKDHPGEAWKDGRTSSHKADQETIANKVYWDRNRSPKYQLGNPDWGDGWKFRGRGISMTTGGSNYLLLGKFIGSDLWESPELVATEFYWESGIFFYNTNNLWKLASQLTVDSMTRLTKKVNGGTHGLQERMKWTRYYYYLLNK